MNNTSVSEPVSAALSSGMSAFRYLLTAAGGVAIGKGWLQQDTLNAIVALSIALAPGIIGAWNAYWNTRAIKAAAPLVPNSIISSN